MTSTTTPSNREQTATTAASAADAQCICQEDPSNGLCGCALPVTREQADRLRAYASEHPERVIIMSETEGAWMSALADFLPPSADVEERILAWMTAPRALSRGAELRSSGSLGELLDMLGASPPATARTPPHP
jgi:hypothetical protein